MTYTQTDLDAIQAAIAKGEKTVQFADRSVTYRSLGELLQAESIISAAITPRRKDSIGVVNERF